jgi:hypothetical protein
LGGHASVQNFFALRKIPETLIGTGPFRLEKSSILHRVLRVGILDTEPFFLQPIKPSLETFACFEFELSINGFHHKNLQL